MSQSLSFPVDRTFFPVPVLLIFMMCTIPTASWGADSAVADSSGVSPDISAPDPSGGFETGTSALPGSDWGALSTSTGGRSNSASGQEKKKRVPKKEPSRGPEESKTVAEEDDGEDCVGSCIGGFFAGLFTSSEKEVVYVTAPAPGDTLPPQVSSYQDQAYPQTEVEPEPERIITPADFSLVLDLSWWRSGPTDVWDEYKRGGVRFGASGYFIVGENFEIGVDAGYSYAEGEPLFDYESSTMLESPQKSQLYIFDLGLRAGMIHTFSPHGPFLRWGLGPRVFYVKETADLEVYSLPDMEYLEDTTESLAKWRLGGDLNVSVLWDVGGTTLVGFSTRLYVIPWESSYTKALTLDHIGTNPLVGFNLGCTVHFNGL